jgi:hypothetical protein
MSTTITINGQTYLIEQGAGGYTYYRVSSTQRFGKKVKAKGTDLIVWNGTDGTPDPNIGINQLPKGTGSDYPPPLADILDIRDLSYDGVTYDLTATYGAEVSDIQFEPNGNRFWTIHTTLERINEFTMDPAYDITSATMTNDQTINGAENSQAFCFGDDGQYIYLSYSNVGVHKFQRYTLGTKWDITSILDNTTPDHEIVWGSDTGTGFTFNDDGTKFFRLIAGTSLAEYACSTPWQISDMTLTDTHAFVEPGFFSWGGEWSSDGRRFYIYNFLDDLFYQYDFETPWDISSISFDTSEALPSGIPTSNNFYAYSLIESEKKMYLVNNATYILYELPCP